MVVEYIRYRVASERQREFEDAWANAQQVLQEATQCLGYEVSHGVEEAENYVVRIEWRSVREHEQGSRQSAAFGRFFKIVKPFLDQIEEMRHYAPTVIVSAP